MPSLISTNEINNLIKLNKDCDIVLFSKICDFILNTETPISHLHKVYQMVYSTIVIQAEIDNGGVYQYYGNNSAELLNEIGIESFRLIGAHKSAKILQEVFDKIYSQSPIFRQEYLTNGICPL